MYALMKYDFLVLFPINPKQLARYREAFRPSGGKDDFADARLLAELLRVHQAQLRPWRPDDQTTRSLRLLSEARRKLVDQRTALGQQMRQTLKEYFPLALQLLSTGTVHAVWFLKLLRRFGTLAELKRLSPKQVATWLPGGRRKTPDDALIPPRLQQIRDAQPLVTDPAIVQTGKRLVQSLAPLLESLNESIVGYDEALAAELAKHPDAALFASFAGAGAALTPRLCAAFGTDRNRFSNATELQALSGAAPVTFQSGKTCAVHRRLACPKFLHQTFHELADHSRKSSAWARAYYDYLRQKKGKGHHATLRALSFKWLRILFHCWKHRTPYDESHYLRRLQLTNSPFLEFLKANPQHDA